MPSSTRTIATKAFDNLHLVKNLNDVLQKPSKSIFIILHRDRGKYDMSTSKYLIENLLVDNIKRIYYILHTSYVI